MKILSSPRFLAIYSGVVTLTFTLTIVFVVAHGGLGLRLVSVDQITVHRINVVEPDGTPRLIIADKAEFPGELFRGRELSRADRRDSAGVIFMNDEGTENGGLIFGGQQSRDGALHSFGHLSFDEYEEDQTLSLDTSQNGDHHFTSYQINDVANGLLTPDVLDAFQKLRSMPDGPEEGKLRAAMLAKYRITERAAIERGDDKSAALRLSDVDGNTRILLRVAPEGTPSMQFLDATGKVTTEWPVTLQGK